MPERIIHQGPGFTIAATDEAASMTHYGSVDHGDGHINHGFVDLTDRPDLVDAVPETQKSVALGSLLRAINAKGSPLMSIGCECGLFELENPRPDGETLQVGGYIDVTFRDPKRNDTESALLDLAVAILQRIPAPPEHLAVSYEMQIQPLKLFFGAGGHFGLMLKPLGYGHTSTEAWNAFEAATAGVEASLEELKRIAGEPRNRK